MIPVEPRTATANGAGSPAKYTRYSSASGFGLHTNDTPAIPPAPCDVAVNPVGASNLHAVNADSPPASLLATKYWIASVGAGSPAAGPSRSVVDVVPDGYTFRQYGSAAASTGPTGRRTTYSVAPATAVPLTPKWVAV